MQEAKFKFETFYILFLSLIPTGFIYLAFKSIAQDNYIISSDSILPVLPAILLSVVVFPMTIRLIIGIPAILLIHNQLVNNIFGFTIDWDNVEYMILEGSYKPFLSITLKDTDKFYSQINNPVKRIFLKLLFSISPGDVSIYLAFVAGNNEAVLGTAQVYWNRYHGGAE